MRYVLCLGTMLGCLRVIMIRLREANTLGHIMNLDWNVVSSIDWYEEELELDCLNLI